MYSLIWLALGLPFYFIFYLSFWFLFLFSWWLLVYFNLYYNWTLILYWLFSYIYLHYFLDGCSRDYNMHPYTFVVASRHHCTNACKTHEFDHIYLFIPSVFYVTVDICIISKVRNPTRQCYHLCFKESYEIERKK